MDKYTEMEWNEHVMESKGMHISDYVNPTEEQITTKLESKKDAVSRKETPVFSGVLAYFKDAINDIARCSFAGQQQHAPDQPLQWHRDKSGDELDALSRHLLEAGTIDNDGIRHSAKIAWRSLANLQKELELAGEAPLSKYNKT